MFVFGVRPDFLKQHLDDFSNLIRTSIRTTGVLLQRNHKLRTEVEKVLYETGLEFLNHPMRYDKSVRGLLGFMDALRRSFGSHQADMRTYTTYSGSRLIVSPERYRVRRFVVTGDLMCCALERFVD